MCAQQTKTRYKEIVKQLERLVAECETLGQEYGEKALELISDYPLYACSSNISYGEGIVIATVFGDIFKQGNEDKLIEEYFKSLPKGEVGSVEGYEQWRKERK